MFVTGLIAILLILAIIAFIIGAVKPVYTQVDSYRGTKEELPIRKTAYWVGTGIAAIAGIITFFSSFTLVQATEVGVPVAWGRVGTALPSGVHFVAPWVKVETYPTRPVTVELAADEKVLARTADAGQMTVEIAARWRVEPSRATELYLQVRTGDDDRISQEIIIKNLRQAVGQIYSVTGNLDALNDRVKTTQLIKEQLDEQLWKYGIIIDDINLRSVEPDEKTAATISQYASQQQATRIAEEAKKTAQIEAERRLIEAQGLEKSAKAVANLSSAQLQVVCMQVWQQVVTRGIDHSTPVYTNPCANTGSIIVNGK
jgi:regulator of protease activity HflC (stomatin/prohibitin superfamily)